MKLLRSLITFAIFVGVSILLLTWMDSYIKIIAADVKHAIIRRLNLDGRYRHPAEQSMRVFGCGGCRRMKTPPRTVGVQWLNKQRFQTLSPGIRVDIEGHTISSAIPMPSDDSGVKMMEKHSDSSSKAEEINDMEHELFHDGDSQKTERYTKIEQPTKKDTAKQKKNSEDATLVEMMNRKKENRRRLDVLNAFCSNSTVGSWSAKISNPVYLQMKKYNLVYCNLKKSDPRAVQNAIQLTGFNDMSRERLGKEGGDRVTEFPLWTNVSGSGLKILIVSRNPYERLYSAYMDRVYLQDEAWVNTNNGIYKNQECKFKPGFEEFLLELIHQLKTVPRDVDLSFLPLSWQCLPCEQDVQYIVHFENYPEEMEFVWYKLGIKGELLTVLRETFQRSISSENNMKVWALSKFSDYLKANTKCIGEIEMAERIWTTLQKKGAIEWSDKFPENDFNKSFPLTPVNLSRLSFRCGNPNATQRDRALTHAYSTVSKDVISRIQALYRADFLLFGYNVDIPK